MLPNISPLKILEGWFFNEASKTNGSDGYIGNDDDSTARADNGRQVDNENAGDDDSYDVNAVD